MSKERLVGWLDGYASEDRSFHLVEPLLLRQSNVTIYHSVRSLFCSGGSAACTAAVTSVRIYGVSYELSARTNRRGRCGTYELPDKVSRYISIGIYIRVSYYFSYHTYMILHIRLHTHNQYIYIYCCRTTILRFYNSKKNEKYFFPKEQIDLLNLRKYSPLAP